MRNRLEVLEDIQHIESRDFQYPHGIEPGIRELVVLLRRLEFWTQMSCEGHTNNLGHHTNRWLYPWVKIGLLNGGFAFGPEARAWRRDIKRLEFYVHRFNGTSHWKYRYRHLTVQSKESGTGLLGTPEYVYLLPAWAPFWNLLSAIPSQWLKGRILKMHQNEMRRFRIFLKRYVARRVKIEIQQS